MLKKFESIYLNFILLASGCSFCSDSFSQNLDDLIFEQRRDSIIRQTLSVLYSCDNDTSFTYMHLNVAGGPHQHITIPFIFCKGIGASFDPINGSKKFDNARTILLEPIQNEVLPAYFTAEYSIQEIETVSKLYRKIELNGQFYIRTSRLEYPLIFY